MRASNRTANSAGLKGHDFSHAGSVSASSWALAPGGFLKRNGGLGFVVSRPCDRKESQERGTEQFHRGWVGNAGGGLVTKQGCASVG